MNANRTRSLTYAEMASPRVARQVGHVPDPADDATVEKPARRRGHTSGASVARRQ
jgi:hypothetical protein